MPGIFGGNSEWKKERDKLLARCDALASLYPNFKSSIETKRLKLVSLKDESKFKKHQSEFDAWELNIKKEAEKAREEKQKIEEADRELIRKKIAEETEAKIEAEKRILQAKFDAENIAKQLELAEIKKKLLALYCEAPAELFAKNGHLINAEIPAFDSEIEKAKSTPVTGQSFPLSYSPNLTRYFSLLKEHEIARYALRDKINKMTVKEQQDKLVDECKKFEAFSEEIKLKIKGEFEVINATSTFCCEMMGIEEKFEVEGSQLKLSPLFSNEALSDEANHINYFHDQSHKKQFSLVCKLRLALRAMIEAFSSKLKNSEQAAITENIARYSAAMNQLKEKNLVVAEENIDPRKTSVIRILEKYRRSWMLAKDRIENVEGLIAQLKNTKSVIGDDKLMELLDKASNSANQADHEANARACFFKRNLISSRYQNALEEARQQITRLVL